MQNIFSGKYLLHIYYFKKENWSLLHPEMHSEVNFYLDEN